MKIFRNAIGILPFIMAYEEAHLHPNKRERPTAKPPQNRRTEADFKKAQGLTPYQYGNETIWALNLKNAERKARKKGLIK